jgi:hypothetical protein
MPPSHGISSLFLENATTIGFFMNWILRKHFPVLILHFLPAPHKYTIGLKPKSNQRPKNTDSIFS